MGHSSPNKHGRTYINTHSGVFRMHGPAIVPHVYRVLQVDTMERNAANARNVGGLLLCQILRVYVRGQMGKLNIYMNKECGEVFSNSYVTDQLYLPRRLNTVNLC